MCVSVCFVITNCFFTLTRFYVSYLLISADWYFSLCCSSILIFLRHSRRCSALSSSTFYLCVSECVCVLRCAFKLRVFVATVNSPTHPLPTASLCTKSRQQNARTTYKRPQHTLTNTHAHSESLFAKFF